jgi:hypothetical protein
MPDSKIADDQHGHMRHNCSMRTVNISDLKRVDASGIGEKKVE